MGNRLKAYLQTMERRTREPLISDEREKTREDLLIQIAFFQHERLVHLLVTLTFAVLTMLCFLAVLLTEQLALILLLVLLLALLVPYVAHYYRLENGVQKLYQYYDRLGELEEK